MQIWSKHGRPKSDAVRSETTGTSWLPLPTVESCHFINDSSEPFDGNETAIVLRGSRDVTRSSPLSPFENHKHHSDRRARQYATPSPPPGLASLPSLRDPRHGHLISYYCERLCPLTVTSHQRTSPFYSLIMPFCTSASSVVSDALLALSARHLSRTDSTWAITAVKLESKVLRDLRHRLAIAKPSEIWRDHELPVVMMLMCLYEILNRCDQRWVVHLKGARDLIRARRAVSGRDPSQQDSINELTRFAERFFAFQDVIGRTACGETPIFGSDYWDASDQVIDAWLGCSPALVSIVCSVTELSRSKKRDYNSITSNDFAVQAATLESELSSLQQVVSAGGNDELLMRSAEIKRMASRVYLHCALYGANPCAQIIKDSVRQVLRQASRFLDEDIAAGMVWPLFVAAVELDPLDDELWSDETTGLPVYGRSLVLRMLEHMGTTSIANVTRTREVICKIWNARDMAMAGEEPPTSSSPPETLLDDDWDRFVAPVSSNISLA